MKPFKIDDDGTPCFRVCDCDDYGMPELYGFHVYRVIDTRELNLVADYKIEQSYDFRQIHRYCRFSRFKSTLLKLIGDKNSVPEHIIQAVRIYYNKQSRDPWNEVRKILKHYKWRKYYDFIPSILSSLQIGKPLKITQHQFDSILNEYRQIAEKFDREKQEMNRKYFPNIRFIVLKLLEKNNLVHSYQVPVARTRRKQKALLSLWETIQIRKTNQN